MAAAVMMTMTISWSTSLRIGTLHAARRGRRRGVQAALVIAATASALSALPARAEDVPAHPQPRVVQLTLASAIDAALAHNPQIAIASENIIVAHARTTADKTLRLPLLAVKGNLQFWDKAIVDNLGPEIGDVTVRPRVIGNVDVSLTQPVSGALVIGRLIDRDRALTDARQAQRDSVRIDIAYQTAEAYLGALQAQTLRQVAQATLKQLDADLQHARILLSAGTLQRSDVLRLEAEHARVEQQLLQADTTALDGRRRLAVLLGMPDGTELELADIDTTPPALAWTEDEAVARARRDRADARAADASWRAAELDVSVSRAAYAPSVSLVAVYSHAIASQAFGIIPNSGYLGVTLDWNLWDWGARGAEVDRAKALGRQARLTQGALADQIAVDTRARWQTARTAQAMLEVAARGLAAAVEAQRLQAVRYAQGASTTVEVIDAETALASAQAQAVIGRYQYLVAWMALAREVGTLPSPPRAN
jgi:outer membrane protein TolC